MWFFMILCYLLTAITFLLLLLSGVQGYFAFKIFHVNHPTLALLTIMMYLFTQTLIIFYFVGIGVSIKEFVIDSKISSEYHKHSIAVKRYVYPPVLLNILFVMTLFISGGAVDTHHMPGWIHGILFCIAILHFWKTITVEHKAFKESTNIVIEMAKATQ